MNNFDKNQKSFTRERIENPTVGKVNFFSLPVDFVEMAKFNENSRNFVTNHMNTYPGE